MKYDYRRHMIDDIKDYIHDHSERYNNLISSMNEEQIREFWYDELWAVNDVTGNENDLYYDSEERCSHYLSENFYLLYEAMEEFCLNDNSKVIIEHFEKRDIAQYFDCTIRCYLLGECLNVALEELKNE